MEKQIKKTTPRSVKVIQVIEVISSRGSGTSNDPVKSVTQYWDKKGNLLFEKDN